jgi:hypothetical protein
LIGEERAQIVRASAVVGFCVAARYKWDWGKRVLVWNGAHGFRAKSTDLQPSVKPVASIVVPDTQNQLFQIPILRQMLNRDLAEQLEHRVLGPTTPYQAQYQMTDVVCKCVWCPVVYTFCWHTDWCVWFSRQLNLSTFGVFCGTHAFGSVL